MSRPSGLNQKGLLRLYHYKGEVEKGQEHSILSGTYHGVNMKILVRNLSRETTQAGVLALFKAYGEVRYCNLVMDKATGESKGFGFVDMPRADEAREAIKELNAQVVDGSKIRVKKAKEAMVGTPAVNPWGKSR